MTGITPARNRPPAVAPIAKAPARPIQLPRGSMIGGAACAPAVAAVASHGLLAMTVTALAAVAAIAVVAVIPDLFWFRALGRPRDDLRWLISSTSPDLVERRYEMLQQPMRAVLEARATLASRSAAAGSTDGE